MSRHLTDLLARLQQMGVASRAELAKSLGLSQPTSGKIVDQLLALGVIEEFEVPTRPADATPAPAPAAPARPPEPSPAPEPAEAEDERSDEHFSVQKALARRGRKAPPASVSEKRKAEPAEKLERPGRKPVPAEKPEPAGKKAAPAEKRRAEKTERTERAPPAEKPAPPPEPAAAGKKPLRKRIDEDVPFFLE